MGADQDAIEVGASIGVAAANSLTYARGAVAPAMAAASSMVGELRTARRHCADASLRGYSEKERRDSAG